MPASSSRDPLEHEGKVEIASCTSAAASTAGSAASDGPEHLESGHWRFQAPNLVLDTEAGKVLAHLVPDPDISCCILQSQLPMSGHPWSVLTLRARLSLPLASAFAISFCACHLPSPSACAICSRSLLKLMVGQHLCVPDNKLSEFCMLDTAH